MKFEKCHGLGNDYLFMRSSDMDLEEASRQAPDLCQRGSGVGADGLVILGEPDKGVVSMRMVNIDGSEGLVCGNALRCVGLLAHRWGWLNDNHLVARTPVGEREITWVSGDDRLAIISVDMGEASFGAVAIGASCEDPISIEGPEGVIEWTAVSTGNPHIVGFVDSLEFDFQKWGPFLSTHDFFPGDVNANFSKVVSRDRMISRIWERGSGSTLACGSGACAGFVAAHKSELVDDRVTVELPLGELQMNLNETGRIQMSGPAQWVYSGVL